MPSDNTDDWRLRLSSDPKVCHGRLCIRGTRVMVDVVLANLEDGEPIESIVRGYNITRDDVVAAVRYDEEQRRIGAND